jgi:hypothetical protein
LGNNLLACYQDSNDGSTRKLLKASTMRNQVWATQSNPERFVSFSKFTRIVC